LIVVLYNRSGRSLTDLSRLFCVSSTLLADIGWFSGSAILL
jgi:hypothetical protein